VLQFKLQAQLFCHVSILHEHDRAAFILVVRSSKALMPSNARVKKPWACHTNAVTHPVLFQTNTAQAKQERKKERKKSAMSAESICALPFIDVQARVSKPPPIQAP
jgi:hypothetical protein